MILVGSLLLYYHWFVDSIDSILALPLLHLGLQYFVGHLLHRLLILVSDLLIRFYIAAAFLSIAQAACGCFWQHARSHAHAQYHAWFCKVAKVTYAPPLDCCFAHNVNFELRRRFQIRHNHQRRLR